MALWFDLRINNAYIGFVEIRRREPLDPLAATAADAWCTYDVRRDGVLLGQVRHCYGHGAWALLAHAARLITVDAGDADVTPANTETEGHRPETASA